MEKQKNAPQTGSPALRFPEFDGEWIEKKINEIAEKVNSGKTPLGGESVYVESGVLFIRSQNVLDSKLSFENSTYITHKVNNTMLNSIVKPKDILLNITGASLGRSCVVPEDFTVGNVNQHVCIIRIDKDNEPYFIQPIFASEKGQNLFNSLQTGSGREGLNFQSIRGIQLFLPSLPEQTKIANFLTAIDTKIQQLTQKKALLEEYKKGVMQQLFSQEIRFKDEKGANYPDWEENPLSEITKIYDGTHMTPDYQKKGVPFYSVEHITGNNFSQTKFISEEVFENENKRVKLEKGDILMTKIGDIGTPKYIDWDVKASFYVSLALIKKQPNNNTMFLSQYIKSKDFQGELHKRIIHVAFPKKINLGEIGNCLVKLPSLPEQQKIANFLFSIDRKIETVTKQIEQTQAYKKGLLQQLFI